MEEESTFISAGLLLETPFECDDSCETPTAAQLTNDPRQWTQAVIEKGSLLTIAAGTSCIDSRSANASMERMRRSGGNNVGSLRSHSTLVSRNVCAQRRTASTFADARTSL